ncbi:MAG: MerR family transcriptional regulator [Rhodococcus sp.]|uniref:MerR family transcriptional regulator n=1 Tax=Rhodococcus TaxID=1827 RepID=UPI0016A29F03|nr:MerR family transcriptional regulator [Rhodococcus sp. (in: high G+C Gram-positive bacteria)]NLV80920.1 MerR family transcriptional regulator [Rhodococcus sp. (in: high G+C Gram-positive bacteria)]
MLIGEVSRRSGVSVRMLRHYDARGLVVPTGRTTGGYREYSAADIRRLFHLECLRTLGLSLTDAKRALDEPDFAPATLVAELIGHTRARIRAEEDLLARLLQVDASAPVDWSDVLQVVSLLHALESDSGGHRQRAVLTQDDTASLPVTALVEALLAEDDPNVAGALQWALVRADGHGLPGLEAGLESPDVVVRRRAVTAIAAVPAAAASRLLRRALDDPDTTIRGRAALELGDRGDAGAAPVLVDLVVEGIRDVEAAERLGTLADGPEAAGQIVSALEHRLSDADDSPAKLRLAQALAEIPGGAALDALTRLARDEDRTVALTAAAILRARKDAR